MGRLIEVNQSTPLGLKLYDDDATQFVRARVYNSSGVEQTAAPFSSPISLTHVVNGFYRASVTPDAEGEYFVVYRVFSDAGFTTLNKKYSEVMEIIQVRSVDQDLATLLSRLTSGRASNLDNLDATISSRLAAASYTAPDNATISTINSKIGTPAATVSGDIAAVKSDTGSTKSVVDANLDAQVSSRLAAASYTAPDNASIAAIKAKTDQLSFTSGRVDSVIAAAQEAAIVDQVWDELLSGHVDVGSAGKALANAEAGSNPADIADAVWDELQSGHTSAGSFGQYLDAIVSSRLDAASYTAPDNSTIAAINSKIGTPVATVSSDIAAVKANTDAIKTKTDQLTFTSGRVDAVISAAQEASIVDGVWDEALSGHTNVGTSGKTLQDLSLSPTGVAQAVWNAARSGYSVAGSFGESLQGVFSSARASLIDNLSRLDVVVSTRANQTTVNDILSDTNLLEIHYTPARAAKLDFLDASINSRLAAAAYTAPPSAASIADAVWDEAQADHLGAGTTGKSLSDGTAVANPGLIADAVWDEARTGHTTPGTFGQFLDAAISERASDADMQLVKGSGFATGTDSLKAIRAKINTLPTSAGDATLANQNTIISQLAAKASQASVNTLQSSVNAIPTNPLLTNDSRLNRLDVNVSTRLSTTDFNVIKGAGFNASTDTLEAIRDAVAASVDLSPVLQGISDIKGAGFDVGTDALRPVRVKVDAAKASADAAASESTAAKNAALGAATSSQAATIIAGVAAIPTNPVLTTDIRIARLDATISSRADATVLAQAMGNTFNPSTDSLESIVDLINSKSYSDATLAKQNEILTQLAGKALQSTLISVQSAVGAIPTNPLLTTDIRLNRLDVNISTRASDADMQAIKGGGFSTGTHSLVEIKESIAAANLDLAPVLSELANIKGTGFASVDDSLDAISTIGRTERAAIKSDTEGLLGSGEGI